MSLMLTACPCPTSLPLAASTHTTLLQSPKYFSSTRAPLPLPSKFKVSANIVPAMFQSAAFPIFALLLTCPTIHPHPSISNRVLDIQTFLIPDDDILKFATIILKHFDARRCTESQLASPETCSRFGATPLGNMNIYVGYDRRTDVEDGERKSSDEGREEEGNSFVYSLEKAQLSPNLISKILHDAGRRHKVVSILPDSTNNKISSEHDIVFVIDPFPDYNFGHFLGLFFIDMDTEAERCEGKERIYLNDRTCIAAAKKPRCSEMTSEDNFKRFVPSYKCCIDFLPTVQRSGHFPTNATENLLKCANLRQFRSCPSTAAAATNRNEGDFERTIPIDAEIRTRCRLFQRCDQALLIGGGWSSLYSATTSEENVRKMHSMLLLNGFLQENIQIFYSNGGGIRSNSKLPRSVPFQSLEKKAELRKHVKRICQSKHCADTFFIYLNTPMMSNGNFLLWDSNDNGLADEEEIYTNEEFASDISRCEAQRVIIVSDQRRGDILLSLLQKSNSHPNVLLSVAASSDQPTRNGELTTIWTNHSHPSACLKHVQQAAALRMKDSFPAFHDTSGGSLLNLSISGAPCEELYSRELRLQYQGCQNLPTSIWFGSLTHADVESSDETVDGKHVRVPTSDSNVSYTRKFS